MDAPTWIVTVLYGLVVGFLLARFKQEQRALRGAMVAMTGIGIVTWLLAPDSIAGPSMAVGGAACLLAAMLSRRTTEP